MSFRSLLVMLVATALSCSTKALPPGLGDFGGVHEGGHSNGTGGSRCINDGSTAPSPDAIGLCGNRFLEVTNDPPNLYFVIDRSGSMDDVVDGRQKYAAVTAAAVGLVRSLGSRANVGAAVFPGRGVDRDHPCAVGQEVFSTKPGDPIQNGSCGDDGPVTQAFAFAVGLTPLGATPTGSTLESLIPTLSGLAGKTIVLLATDGGPNCNVNSACDEKKCIPNIEMAEGCTPGINCCGPLGIYGPGDCLDDAGTRLAVTHLRDKGIKTYVVGVPGSAPYASLLDELATAGGTARASVPGAPLYYDVQHVSELDDALASIAANAVQGCEIRLTSPPPNSGLVNVYLDGQAIPYGPNGWLWGPVDRDGASGDVAQDADDAPDAADDDAFPEASLDDGGSHSEIDLVGEACRMLLSGKYRRLQVVFGCPTDLPK